MTRRYDLLAIDLDGTLLTRSGEVSPRNRQALRDARDAGLAIVICTGRGLAECRHILRDINQLDPVVVAGGSIIACPSSSRTLHRFGVPQPLVHAAVNRLLDHDHPALVLKDHIETGYDYLVVRGSKRLSLDPVTQWWFSAMNVNVRTVDRLDDDPHPQHTVRVGACGTGRAMARAREALLDAARLNAPGHDAHIHHFPAVVAPDHAATTDEGDRLHVLELFNPSATKWSAIRVLLDDRRIPPSRVAAIGDEINDVSMIKAAGLGIAMGNAVPAVREVASRHTLHHNDDGVAHAIDHILAGRW